MMAAGQVQTLHTARCLTSCDAMQRVSHRGFRQNGDGEAEDEENYIYYGWDLFIFVYIEKNIYLHQPNETFKRTK